MIEITTNIRGAAAMRATAAYLQALALIAEADVPPARIAPEDNPETGAPLPPVAALPAPANDLAAATAAFSAPAAASVPVPPPQAVAPAAPASASDTTVPPVPPVAAPAPSAGGSAVNPAGVKLDKRGIPWDSRIHSTPATKTADGVWRKRRNMNDDALVARVEAELLTAQRVPAPAAASVPVPPSAAGAAVPTVSVAPAVAASPTNLPELLAAAAPYMTAQRLDMPRVIEACRVAGLEGLAGLQTRPDLVPGVWVEVLKRVAQ